MNGLIRRTHGVHQWDVEVLGDADADAALGPLRGILAHIDEAVKAGAGSARAGAKLLPARSTSTWGLSFPMS